MMTKGIFVLITEAEVLRSFQFNGDMFFEYPGYGNDAMEMLRNVRNEEEFRQMILLFNSKYHRYKIEGNDACVVIPMQENTDNRLDISQHANVMWSDYSFIKNATQKKLKILCADKKMITVSPFTSVALFFGATDKDNIPEKFRKNYPEEVGARNAVQDLITQHSYTDIVITERDRENIARKVISAKDKRGGSVFYPDEAKWILHLLHLQKPQRVIMRNGCYTCPTCHGPICSVQDVKGLSNVIWESPYCNQCGQHLEWH